MKALIFGLVSLVTTFTLYGFASQMRGSQSTFLYLKYPAYIFIPIIPIVIGILAIIYGITQSSVGGIILGIVGIVTSLALMLGLFIGG